MFAFFQASTGPAAANVVCLQKHDTGHRRGTEIAEVNVLMQTDKFQSFYIIFKLIKKVKLLVSDQQSRQPKLSLVCCAR